MTELIKAIQAECKKHNLDWSNIRGRLSLHKAQARQEIWHNLMMTGRFMQSDIAYAFKVDQSTVATGLTSYRRRKAKERKNATPIRVVTKHNSVAGGTPINAISLAKEPWKATQ